MKKFLNLLVIMVLCLSLVGCGSSIPEGMSKEDYEYGEKLLNIVDDYIDAEISVNDAFLMVDGFSKYFTGDDENTLALKKSAKELDSIFGHKGNIEKVKTIKSDIEKALGI